jgi:pimeloyl-ACP methyl ester carboxylesterase
MIAQRTQGQLVVLPGLGHSPHVEAPAVFAPLLFDFLCAALVHGTGQSG